MNVKNGHAGFLIVLLSLVSQLGSSVDAQEFKRLMPAFVIEGETLRLATLGGLNNPQLSAVDLNADGRSDLYIFDRTGNRHLTFLFDGQQYRYAPEYAAAFPDLSEWVLLRDYNGDGIADLFAYSTAPGISGMLVYTGYYEGEKIAFRRLHRPNPYDLLDFPLPAGGRTPIYISRIDYPAVDDLDCDGDLDIATFNVAGGYVEWYQNRSVELGYGRDSLIFRLADDCWGGIFESGITPEIDLADAPGACAGRLTGPDPVLFRHAGSTLLTFDADGDGDRELILGDLSFSNLVFLHNGGTCARAWMNRQEVFYPPGATPVDLPFFPAAFYLDLNGDGRPDLAAAPNAAQESENVDVLWYYENTGTAAAPRFDFRRRDFLVGEMLDFGTDACPAFADVDADGLIDLVVGNGTRYSGPGRRQSRLFLFRNTGTPASPRFELTDGDYLGMSRFNPEGFNFTPTFADLDSDGDLDLVVGEEFGALYVAENTAGPGRPMSFGPWQFPYAGIDVGQGSVPAVADLNGDGRPDLIVGERNGNINYFQNQGSATDPIFVADPDQAPNTAFLGGVDARVPGSIVGYSAPLIAKVGGAHRLLTGTDAGAIEYYGDLAANLYGQFTALDLRWGGIGEGFRTRLALADIDGDGRLDAAVGNARGGLAFYRTDLPAETVVGLPNRPAPERPLVDVSPNPARGQVRLDWRAGRGSSRQVRLLDLGGRVLYDKTWQEDTLLLPLSGIPAGVYLITVRETYTGRQSTRRLVVLPQ